MSSHNSHASTQDWVTIQYVYPWVVIFSQRKWVPTVNVSRFLLTIIAFSLKTVKLFSKHVQEEKFNPSLPRAIPTSSSSQMILQSLDWLLEMMKDHFEGKLLIW